MGTGAINSLPAPVGVPTKSGTHRLLGTRKGGGGGGGAREVAKLVLGVVHRVLGVVHRVLGVPRRLHSWYPFNLLLGLDFVGYGRTGVLGGWGAGYGPCGHVKARG